MLTAVHKFTITCEEVELSNAIKVLETYWTVPPTSMYPNGKYADSFSRENLREMDYLFIFRSGF